MAFGALLLLDTAGGVSISAGWYGAAACIMLGVGLCASGLGARRR